MGQADKGREDAEAGWEGQVETDIGSTQAKEKGAGWTGQGRLGDLGSCNMGEMVEVGEQVTTAACENRT